MPRYAGNRAGVFVGLECHDIIQRVNHFQLVLDLKIDAPAC